MDVEILVSRARAIEPRRRMNVETIRSVGTIGKVSRREKIDDGVLNGVCAVDFTCSVEPDERTRTVHRCDSRARIGIV